MHNIAKDQQENKSPLASNNSYNELQSDLQPSYSFISTPMSYSNQQNLCTHFQANVSPLASYNSYDNSQSNQQPSYPFISTPISYSNQQNLCTHFQANVSPLASSNSYNELQSNQQPSYSFISTPISYSNQQNLCTHFQANVSPLASSNSYNELQSNQQPSYSFISTPMSYSNQQNLCTHFQANVSPLASYNSYDNSQSNQQPSYPFISTPISYSNQQNLCTHFQANVSPLASYNSYDNSQSNQQPSYPFISTPISYSNQQNLCTHFQANVSPLASSNSYNELQSNQQPSYSFISTPISYSNQQNLCTHFQANVSPLASNNSYDNSQSSHRFLFINSCSTNQQPLFIFQNANNAQCNSNDSQSDAIYRNSRANPNFGLYNKINDLKKQIRSLNASHSREIGRYKSRTELCTIEINDLQKEKGKLINLTSQIKSFYNNYQGENNNEMAFITIELMNQIIENLKEPKRLRRYSEPFYDFSMLLYSQSPKCYKVLRQILPFPSKSSLYNKYSDIVLSFKTSLINIELGIEQIKSLDFQGDCTLAIDAFSFRTFSGTVFGTSTSNTSQNSNITKDTQSESSNQDEEETEEEMEEEIDEEISNESLNDNPSVNIETEAEENNKDISNGFIFLLIPLSSSIPAKIIHIAIANSGSYNDEINKIADFIKDKLREAGINPLFQATDGDRGVSHLHNDFFDFFMVDKGRIHFKDFRTLLSNVYLETISRKQTIPVSDPLHLLKTFRGRLINYCIKILPNGKVIDCNQIEQILQLGAPLCDKSHLSRMRDSFPLQILTFTNIIKLIKNKQGSAAMLFFPYTCLITTIFCENISFEFRLELLEISYYFFSMLFCHFQKLKEEGISERGGQGSPLLTFIETHYLIRLINTIISLGVSFVFGPEDLRADSIGTHLVENAIGIARSNSFDPRWCRILTSFALSELRKMLAKKLGIKLYIQKRVNDGGCKIHSDNEDMIKKPDWWCPTILYDVFESLSIDGFEESHPHEVSQLIVDLENLAKHTNIKTVNSSEVAGSQIIARLLKFKGNINLEIEE